MKEGDKKIVRARGQGSLQWKLCLLESFQNSTRTMMISIDILMQEWGKSHGVPHLGKELQESIDC